MSMCFNSTCYWCRSERRCDAMNYCELKRSKLDPAGEDVWAGMKREMEAVGMRQTYPFENDKAEDTPMTDAKDDIVARLRCYTGHGDPDVQDDDCQEAAQEIERLREALRRASEALYNVFEPDNQSAAWWEVQRALAALAAERTQEG